MHNEERLQISDLFISTIVYHTESGQVAPQWLANTQPELSPLSLSRTCSRLGVGGGATPPRRELSTPAPTTLDRDDQSDGDNQQFV